MTKRSGDPRDEFFRLLNVNGAVLVRQKKNLVFKLPDGQQIVSAKHSRDPRAWKNALSQLRRCLHGMRANGFTVRENPAPEIEQFWAWLTPADRAHLEPLPRSHPDRTRAYQAFLASPDRGLPASTLFTRLPWREPGLAPLPPLVPGRRRAAHNPDDDCYRTATGAIEKYLVPLAAGRGPHARDVAHFPLDEAIDPYDAAVKGYVVGLRRALVSVAAATSPARGGRASWSAAREQRAKTMRKNPDEDLRRTEREHAQTGDVHARARLLAERMRAGLVTPEQLSVAGYLGDEAAALVVPAWSPRSIPSGWLSGPRLAITFGPITMPVAARIAADVAERACDGKPNRNQRLVIQRVRDWAACPCGEHFDRVHPNLITLGDSIADDACRAARNVVFRGSLSSHERQSASILFSHGVSAARQRTGATRSEFGPIDALETEWQRKHMIAVLTGDLPAAASNPRQDDLGPVVFPVPEHGQWRPPGATPDSLSPGEIKAAMRRARVTLRDVALTAQLDLKRVRELINRGIMGAVGVHDMLERITAASHAKHLDRGIDVTMTGMRGYGAAGMFLGRARIAHKGTMGRKAAYIDAYQRLLRFVQLTPASTSYYSAIVDGLNQLGRQLEHEFKVNLGTLKPTAQPNPGGRDADVREILRGVLAGSLPPKDVLLILQAIDRGALPVEWTAHERSGYGHGVSSARVGHVARVGRPSHAALVLSSGAYHGGGGRWTIDGAERLARTSSYPFLARLVDEERLLDLPVPSEWKERCKQTPEWKQVHGARQSRAAARRRWRLAQQSQYYDPDQHGHLAPNPPAGDAGVRALVRRALSTHAIEDRAAAYAALQRLPLGQGIEERVQLMFDPRVASIWLRRAEGPNDETGEVTLTAESPDESSLHLWHRADAQFRKWGRTAPPPGGGYNKCDFKITWEDGETYEGRFDLQRGGYDDSGQTLRGHVLSFLLYSANRIRPAWTYEPRAMRDRVWERMQAEHRESGQEAEALKMLRRYFADARQPDGIPRSAT